MNQNSEFQSNKNVNDIFNSMLTNQKNNNTYLNKLKDKVKKKIKSISSNTSNQIDIKESNENTIYIKT